MARFSTRGKWPITDNSARNACAQSVSFYRLRDLCILFGSWHHGERLHFPVI